MKLPKATRGPGLWKFNNSLLKDKEYIKQITDSYPIIREKYAGIEDKRLKWKLIKMEIRSITIPFATHKAKQFRNQESDKSINNSRDDQNIEAKLKGIRSFKKMN